jgi:hypothetical protein
MPIAAFLRRPKPRKDGSINFHWDGSIDWEDVPGVTSVNHITAMYGPEHHDQKEKDIDGHFFGKLSLVEGTKEALATIDAFPGCLLLTEALFTSLLDRMSSCVAVVSDIVTYNAASTHTVQHIEKNAHLYKGKDVSVYGLTIECQFKRSAYPTLDYLPTDYIELIDAKLLTDKLHFPYSNSSGSIRITR